MVRLKWENRDSGLYQQGVSHGVFYGEDGVGHAWSGLISVTEKPQTNAPTPVYNSLGEKYDIFGNIAEKKHGLSCYTYPEAMEDYLGTEYLDEFGFRVDERPPKKFHMAYRVELGNGLYELHILLNQIATFGETVRSTITNAPALTTITMNLEGVPDPRIKTSHIILDSRLPLTESAETLLFGDRYTEPNINTFLTAQPVWETVATNYAPIIEPDYDNYVWLGRENLMGYSRTPFSPVKEFNTSMFNYNFGDVYHIVRITPTSMPPAGSEIIATVSATLPPGRTTMRLYAQNDSSNEPVGTLVPIGGGLYQLKTTMREGEYQWFNLYGAAHALEQQNNPGDVYVEWVKIERGTIPTPWTPAPSDPDQKPRPSDPYPENYKPGVKYGNMWDHRNQSSREVIAFYDENTGGVGVYCYAESDSGVKGLVLSPYRRELHQGSTVKFESEVIIHTPMNVDNSMLGRIRIASALASTSDPIPNVRGTYKAYTERHNYATDLGSVGRVYAFRGGFVGDPYITYKNWLATTSDYTGEFFDVHTTPKTKGDRYQRVVSPYGDYTIHQQLRLRSTSKVKLSDITQYDFWLDAADSMLLSQNETFTFNGPQAVIDGDTFTIDDSIQGYAEG